MLVHVRAELVRWEKHRHDTSCHCVLATKLDEVLVVYDLHQMVWNDEMMLARVPRFFMRQSQYNGLGNAA